MRCNLCVIARVALLVPGVAGLASAQTITLQNPGFEEPVAAKTVGDATWSNIPGWTSTGPSADSGVESEGSLGTTFVQDELETNIAFLQSGDGIIFQTTSYLIQSDESYLATFFQRNDFNAPELTARLYYDDGGTRTAFGEATVALTGGGREGPHGTGSVTGTPPSAAIGLPLGIEFENTSNGGATGGWAWIDVVSLLVSGGPGDVNGDGSVNIMDYNIIRDHFRMDVASRDLGDLNLDGTVDFIDFIEWRENATEEALELLGNASIPEPAALLLALGAASFAPLRPRRR